MKVFLLISLAFLLLYGESNSSEDSLAGGTVIGHGVFGLVHDVRQNPLKNEQDRLVIVEKSSQDFLFEREKQMFMLSLFDSVPGSVYLTHYRKTEQQAVPVTTEEVDFSAWKGAWSLKAGVKSAWDTLLSWESFDFDSKGDEYVSAIRGYFLNNPAEVAAYDYGWMLEVVLLNSKGESKAIKHYPLGRFPRKAAAVMPDEKTVYMMDDAPESHLFLFVAATPKDFSKGELYVAKTAAQGAIKWISLGNSSTLRIKMKLRKPLQFSGIYTAKDPENGKCPKGYNYADSRYGEECLKVKKSMRRFAGVLETLREASIKGAKPFLKEATALAVRGDRLAILKKDTTIHEAVFTEDQKLQSQFIIKEIR